MNGLRAYLGFAAAIAGAVFLMGDAPMLTAAATPTFPF